MPRFPLVLITLGFFFPTAISAGEEFDSTDKDTYTIEIERDFQVDERFSISASGVYSQTITAGTGNEKNQNRHAVTVRLKGNLKVLKVSKENDPRKLRLQIEMFQWQTPQDEKENKSRQLSKGDVLIIESGKRAPQVTVEDRDISFPEDVRELLSELVPIDDLDSNDRAPKMLEQITGDKQWKIGESREIDPVDPPDVLKNAKSLKMNAKFMGLKKVKGAECYHMRITFDAQGVGLKDVPVGDRATATGHAQLDGFLPRDSDAPARKNSNSMSYNVELSGEDAKLISGIQLVQETERILIPTPADQTK